MKRRPTIRSESGQAIIEYILVLVVVVGVVLGAAYQFNSAFRTYVTNYFGAYVACLLETGELPVLGAPNGGAICDTQFRPRFDLANGQPLLSGGGGGGGASGGGSGGGSSGGNSGGGGGGGGSSRGGGSENTSDGGGGGVDSGNQAAGPTSAASMVNRRGRPPQQTIGEVNDGGANDGRSGLSVSRNRGLSAGELARDSGRIDRMTVDRRFFSDKDLEQRTTERPLTMVVPKDQQGSSLRPKAITYEARKPATKLDDTEGDGFSFGNLIRWLLIAAIIIALVVVLGGQAVQISKGWEK